MELRSSQNHGGFVATEERSSMSRISGGCRGGEAPLTVRLVVPALLLAGCGGGNDDTAPPPHDAGGADVATGCAAGEATRDDGSCEPAGVRPKACGQGFEADQTGGCRAILPDAPCDAGQMALPGETACRPVAPCGSGPWGDIPVEASTEYVNGAYAGTDSDGSKTKPWKTIQAGIDAAAAGAIVAIAEGSYSENPSLYGKQARLWGKCPSAVEIVGSSAQIATVDLGYAFDGTELHDLAIRGPQRGAIASGSKKLVLERIWIHDTGLIGLILTKELDDTELTLRSSLVEATQDIGIIDQGVVMHIEDSVVRGTKLKAGKLGRGVELDAYPGGPPGTASLTGSVVEDNGEAGVYVSGSTLTVERTVVRDTAGRGFDINDDPTIHARANVEIQSSVVERSVEMGLFVGGADLGVESSVVRDTRIFGQKLGRGINLQMDPVSGERSAATVKTSLIERSADIGICVMSSDAVVEDTLVRETKTVVETQYGDGISAVGDLADATLTLTRCRSETSTRAGVASFGATISIEATRLECNVLDLNGEIFLQSGTTNVPPTFHDLGGNACGCDGNDVPCEVKGVNLNAPTPPG